MFAKCVTSDVVVKDAAGEALNEPVYEIIVTAVDVGTGEIAELNVVPAAPETVTG